MNAFEPVHMIRRVLIVEGIAPETTRALRGHVIHPSITVEVVAAADGAVARARDLRPHLILVGAGASNPAILEALRRDPVLRFVRTFPISQDTAADETLRPRILRALGLLHEDAAPEPLAMRIPGAVGADPDLG